MSTVLLLQPDALVAERLRALIESSGGIKVLGCVPTLAEARAALRKITPDVVVSDLLLPGGATPASLAMLRVSRLGRTRLLLIASSTEDPRLLHALEAGVDGYFVPGRHESLTASLAQLQRGESMMSAPLARKLKAHFELKALDDSDFVDKVQNPLRLTDTERLLLDWVAGGYLPAEVAHGLQLSLHEFGVCVRTIYRKLQFDVQADTLSLAA